VGAAGVFLQGPIGRPFGSGGGAAPEGLAQGRSGRLLRSWRDPVASALSEGAPPNIERGNRSSVAERASL